MDVVSDLVFHWGWNRRTVCGFIDRLVELGLITAKENRKRYTLLSLAIDFPNGPQEYSFIYDMAKYDTISEAARLWLSGENTDYDVIEAVSEICEKFSDPNGSQIDNLMLMYCFLRQVLKSVTLSMVEPLIHPDAESCRLLKSFGANLGVSLETLGSAIDGMSFERRNPADTSRPNVTAEDRRIIEQLIRHLWPGVHRDRI